MAIDKDWKLDDKLAPDLEGALSELIFETGGEFSVVTNNTGKAKIYILLKDKKKYCEERTYREILSYIVGVRRGFNLYREEGNPVSKNKIPYITRRETIYKTEHIENLKSEKKPLPWEMNSNELPNNN